MLIIASFSYSTHLELAICYLERYGIQREKIFALPLEKRQKKKKLFDTIYQADGVSLFDLPIILGTIFMLGGTMYGFLLKWGPILCGIIASIIGALIGFVIDIIPKKRIENMNNGKDSTTQIFLLIECKESQIETVEEILFDNLAFGIAKIENTDIQETEA